MGWPRDTSLFPEPTSWNGDEPDPMDRGELPPVEDEPPVRISDSDYRFLKDCHGLFVYELMADEIETLEALADMDLVTVDDNGVVRREAEGFIAMENH